MNINIDWSILRRTTIVLTLSVLVSGSLMAASWYYRNTMETEYTRQHNRYLSMSRKYLTVDEEERTIKSYYPLYQELERNGVIGEEQRLDWIDTLRGVAANIKLPSLRYEISARAPYKPDFELDAGMFQLFSSQIVLQLGLFHEGDLINMLAALEYNSPGIFSVDQCTMKRSGQVLQRNPTRSNITASCKLRWVTLKPRAAS